MNTFTCSTLGPLRWKSTANCRSRKGPALGIGLAKKYRIPRPDLQKA
jgi:hypothetical protein